VLFLQYCGKSTIHIDNPNGYKQCTIDVYDQNNKVYSAITYIANAAIAQRLDSNHKLYPKQPFCSYIQKFLHNNKLSSNYKKMLLNTDVIEGGLAKEYLTEDGGLKIANSHSEHLGFFQRANNNKRGLTSILHTMKMKVSAALTLI